MKKNMAMSIGCLILAGMLGCCNIEAHSSIRKELAGMYSGTREYSPYVALAFLLPFIPETSCFYVPFYCAIFGWPICLTELSLEVVADTMTFPYDFYVWAIAKENDAEVPAEAVPAASADATPAPKPANKQGVEP